MTFYTNLVRGVGGEITEKKLIDYIPEPQRNELITQFKKIEFLRKKILVSVEIRGNKIAEPASQEDIYDVLQIMAELATSLYDANTGLVEVTGLFFKEKEEN